MKLEAKYIRQIRATMSKLPHFGEADKCAMVMQFTGGRTTHISEMRTYEAIDLIRSLNGQREITSAMLRNDEREACNLMRRKILAKAHKMRWEHENGKVDMQRVDNWCLQYGGFGKLLNGHSYEELVNLVTQFNNMYRKFVNQF